MDESRKTKLEVGTGALIKYFSWYYFNFPKFTGLINIMYKAIDWTNIFTFNIWKKLVLENDPCKISIVQEIARGEIFFQIFSDFYIKDSKEWSLKLS